MSPETKAFAHPPDGRADDVGFHNHVVIDELRRVDVVGHDPAHFGCSQEDVAGFVGGQKGVDRCLICEIQLNSLD